MIWITFCTVDIELLFTSNVLKHIRPCITMPRDRSEVIRATSDWLTYRSARRCPTSLRFSAAVLYLPSCRDIHIRDILGISPQPRRLRSLHNSTITDTRMTISHAPSLSLSPSLGRRTRAAEYAAERIESGRRDAILEIYETIARISANARPARAIRRPISRTPRARSSRVREEKNASTRSTSSRPGLRVPTEVARQRFRNNKRRSGRGNEIKKASRLGREQRTLRKQTRLAERDFRRNWMQNNGRSLGSNRKSSVFCLGDRKNASSSLARIYIAGIFSRKVYLCFVAELGSTLPRIL